MYFINSRALIQRLAFAGTASPMMIQHCTNIIQMFCVYWDVAVGGLTVLSGHSTLCMSVVYGWHGLSVCLSVVNGWHGLSISVSFCVLGIVGSGIALGYSWFLKWIPLLTIIYTHSALRPRVNFISNNNSQTRSLKHLCGHTSIDILTSQFLDGRSLDSVWSIVLRLSLDIVPRKCDAHFKWAKLSRISKKKFKYYSNNPTKTCR